MFEQTRFTNQIEKIYFLLKKIDFLKYIVERNETRINLIKFQIIKN